MQLQGTVYYVEPQVVEFPTAVDLLRHLSVNDDDLVLFQTQIQNRLRMDPVVKEWHRQRTRIGATKHFKVYRRSTDYERYHRAARAVAANRASPEQHQLARGLDGEIAASRNKIPLGQLLFHGRGDRDLDSSPSYASFISTSLVPIVAINHAIKRKFAQGGGGKAIVYALTLRSAMPAIWGNGGKLKEFELLLQTKLSCRMTTAHNGTRFDIIEATIEI